MSKKFTSKEDFMIAIKGIAVDGSVLIDLKGGMPKVPKEKQFSYVEEAEKRNLQDAIDNLPTALRFELIKAGYEELLDNLNFSELDQESDYWPGRMTSYLLRKFPHLENKLNWNKLKNMWLAQVLIDQPQFAEKVDFSKIQDVRSFAELISKRPEFSYQFDLSRLNDEKNAQYWFKILEKQPQFSKQCNWDLINDFQKKKLKELHPSLDIK